MKLPPLPKLQIKQVRQVRLLPIVIAAGCALLALKGIGIMTGGGYVLTGPLTVQAAGGGASGGGGGAEGGADPTMSVPVDPTLNDSSPTMKDRDPTLTLREEAAASGGGHGAPAAPAEGDHAAPAAEGDHAVPAADADHSAPEGADMAGGTTSCPPAGADAAEGHGEVPAAPDAAADHSGGASAGGGETECYETAGHNAAGDALPLIKDSTGNMVPLVDEEAGSENMILQRLAARRDELEVRSSELDMRLALIEAAEKRIDERTAALQVLEERINAMVDEKRSLEEAQFNSVVITYEAMKPKDAAAIFDQLEMEVLVRVARAISPRKLAPIMAKMDPTKAKDLTAHLAVDQVEPTIDVADPRTAELPQIVGQ